MIRWLVVCVLMSAGAVTLVHTLVGPSNPTSADPVKAAGEVKAAAPAVPERPAPAAPGRQTLAELIDFPGAQPGGMPEVVIMHGARLSIADQQEVPAEKDGKLLFLGTEVKSGEVVPPGRRLPPAELGFLAVQVDADYNDPNNPPFKSPNNPNSYRRLRDGEEPEPGKVIPARDFRDVRKLQIGEKVVSGQLLGLVNPRMAFEELAIKVEQLKGAEAEKMASRQTKEEYQRKYEAMVKQDRDQSGSVSKDDLYGTRMQWHRYASEEKVKEAGVARAQRELSAALTALKMHEVRASVSGTVRAIYKNSEGEAVKALEPLVQIQSADRLRVEGLLEVQEALKLAEGMPVIVEASRPEHPRLVLGGHLHAVNCVAVSQGKRPIVVSGGEDQTLRGWGPVSGKQLWRLQGLNSAVRSAACTPPAARSNLVLFGTSDGTARLLDLDNRQAGPRELAARHGGSINAVAFSPDGEVCATGGDDRAICLWETSSGKQLYRLTDHRGPVTSLQFTADGKLVSAARDNRLLVWDVTPGQPPVLAGREFDGRGGEVAQLGVSPDGKTVLFDQGKELRLLSLAGRQIEGTLQNPSGELNFSTMALFSPDGKTILTNGLAPGRLQLWRMPDALGRASELRQFVWTSGVASCGAFAPDGSFVVTGTQDHQVLVWAMPGKEEVQARLKGRLILVDRHLDTHSRQVRVWAEVDNPGWLIPGGSATVVIAPQR